MRFCFQRWCKMCFYSRLEKNGRWKAVSQGGDTVMNKGMSPSGISVGLVAYFTVGGPISWRQSEPTRIHHRMTLHNNLSSDRECLSKPSYLFISPATPSTKMLLSRVFRHTVPIIFISSSCFPSSNNLLPHYPQIFPPSRLSRYSPRIGNTLLAFLTRSAPSLRP